ncbi:DUF2784 domain-containing protein [Photobacterium sp. MCCC 1A19761]|uniref:DUF2784 domain-containing protein n=1 Tax=Photobacterium sp. MCCC 1A19761 TaxID=3115000 RepID=UPI00307EC933
MADIVVILHLLFIVFVVFGGVLLWWRRAIAWLHVPAVIWVLVLSLMGWICPLTPLENRLRMMAGQSGYPGGFIDHYLLPIIYPPGLSHATQLWVGLAVFTLNLLLYLLLYLWVYKGEATRRFRGRGN